ncbi:hypothetical protein CARUB_v10005982mg [Capsella rubella]|uniref:RRM domain-containing protein n=1 Tax=Capsella rubella TaxID=81985 RepID=R0F6Z0_9BRAS|nr:nucleolin 1 [Capsella rubella]EOA17617.1 hypothetical protein CARUB_v10005982mg [Capsella rubella]
MYGSVFGRQDLSISGRQNPPVVGGWRILDDPEIRAYYLKPRFCWYADVEGFDTSLPADEIKESLINHFKSCGVIGRVFLDTNPETNVVDSHASIVIIGEDADTDEKVMELNGSELGGRKLTVKVELFVPPKLKDAPFN